MPYMNDNSHQSTAPWYVMCHLNPKQIEVMLRKERNGEFCKSGEKPSPFKFYIPFLYMPVAETPNSSEYTKELRNDFHHFVFIQASGSRLDEIVTSDWNTKTRLHLYYYRDHEGRNVIVSDSEVRRLMSTFKDQTLKFFIGQPIDEFTAGDEVVLNINSWAGQKGVIKDIRLKKGKLTMTISMNIFSQTKSINFTDLKTGDITFEDPEKDRLFSGNPIDHMEEEVIDILSHKCGNTVSEEVIQADATRLKRLSSFDRIYMDDDDVDYARYLSLRLISAVLRQSKKREENFQKEVESHLAGKDHPTTADEAYLMMALFIATRLAKYRNAVKTYRTTHPDCPDILRRYHSIVKKLKSKG